MFEYLSGRLANLTPANVVIDCNGVGYLLEISLNTYSSIQQKEMVQLWVHEIIREDVFTLYGFHTLAERDLFRLLIGVSGVGASTARMILSSLSSEELTSAISGQDAKLIQKVKGVGAKTAQRIIIELHDKVANTGMTSSSDPAQSHNKEEALSALVMLGFAKAPADKVLQGLDNSLTVEELIKEALSKL